MSEEEKYLPMNVFDRINREKALDAEIDKQHKADLEEFDKQLKTGTSSLDDEVNQKAEKILEEKLKNVKEEYSEEAVIQKRKDAEFEKMLAEATKNNH